jgi:signal recognition particle protein SRP9
MTDPKPPRGALELKTYDPITGVALKYRTTKAAEVSRLILSLGRLGRAMAALPDVQEEEIAELPAKEEEAKTTQQQPQASAPGKKKKKGKK